MLAKLIPSNAAKPFAAVEWPSAAPSDEDADVLLADSGAQLRDAVQLRSQIASLQSELTAARRETERRVAEALSAGRQDANESTRKLLEQQVESELSKLRQMIRDLSVSGSKLRRQAEEDLVRLSIAIARRILHRELTIDPDALIGLVKAAFDRLDQREIQQLRTDPASITMVRKLVEGLDLARTVKVIADPSLRAGSLLIETTRGELDASIETQLNEIQRGFIDIVHHS